MVPGYLARGAIRFGRAPGWGAAPASGVPATGAVHFVREHYDGRAVETPGQRRFVRRFPQLLVGG
jgi:hypothetical protein